MDLDDAVNKAPTGACHSCVKTIQPYPLSTCECVRCDAKLLVQYCWRLIDSLREIPLSDSKQDESFKVVDRRLFTPEGEFRKEVAEQQDRERETAPAANPAGAAGAGSNAGATAAGSVAGMAATPGAIPSAVPPADAPKRSPVFENLIRSLGQNAAMLLGGYADPRTGQPVLDLEGAREMIDMLDVLREKTRGNLAPEEDTLLLDVLGNLKLAFMEMTKAAAAAAMQDKVKSRT